MIRFVSEGGTATGLKMLDTVTGQDVCGILSMEYGAKIELGEMVTADCRVCMAEVDVVAGKTRFLTRHPVSKQFEPLRSMEFEDGVRVSYLGDGAPTIHQTFSVAEVGTGRVHHLSGAPDVAVSAPPPKSGFVPPRVGDRFMTSLGFVTVLAFDGGEVWLRRSDDSRYVICFEDAMSDGALMQVSR